ncbi:hypothetical protein U27_01537 [Candidatus Vecturithrix granuli]|uniref:Uncharacterized protein n=1 Tax=Vecturithrix granuli TaxID=1499967 RepID=A0A081CAN1_VECG1|nr:hypothetical protein U27_01537 [Candidatus Vecturithrix granuli]
MLAPSGFKPFQGLFRVSTNKKVRPLRGAAKKFQTLPGIIPRFYSLCHFLSWGSYGVSNPSRDYSAFLLLEGHSDRVWLEGRFKPFQGLFRVSTRKVGARQSSGINVSNPSRDYSAFLRPSNLDDHWSPFLGFKPFQGLFRVSTKAALHLGQAENSFKPFQGLFRVSTYLGNTKCG